MELSINVPALTLLPPHQRLHTRSLALFLFYCSIISHHVIFHMACNCGCWGHNFFIYHPPPPPPPPHSLGSLLMGLKLPIIETFPSNLLPHFQSTSILPLAPQTKSPFVKQWRKLCRDCIYQSCAIAYQCGNNDVSSQPTLWITLSLRTSLWMLPKPQIPLYIHSKGGCSELLHHI